MAEYETHVFTNLQENLEKIVLENITSVTLNTEVLRVNFEAIVTILKGLAKKVDQGQDGANQTSKDVRDLRDRLEKLEDKQNKDKNELNDKIFNNQQQTDHNTKDIKEIQDSLRELKEKQDSLANLCQNDLKQKLDQHDKQIQDILDRIGSSNSNDTDKLNDQIAEIHKLLEDFVKKDEFNGYKDQTDNKLQSHQNSIDDLYSQLKDLKALVSDKLNCETFDEHLVDYNNIKNIVIALANNNGDQKNVVQQVIQAGPALSTKDANLLKELGQKFPELENLVKKLQRDLDGHLLNYKTFSEDATKKIHNNDENLKNFKVEINKRVSDLEAAFKSLREQLLNFNSSSSTSNSGSVESSADVRKLQLAITSLMERVDNAEKDITDLKKLNEKVNVLQDTTNEHRNKINAIEEELIDLKSLKARIEMIEQLLREREKDGHKAKASKGGSFENGGGVTLEQVKQIVDDEIRKLRDEIWAILDELRALLEKKADMDDLMKSEAALLEKLDQIAGALMKRAQADKNDTKKALMFLEKKINELSLIVLGGTSNSEEGAIFAKKPWTPWSCASCDSKLKDYPGPLIDHKHWNKLPQRETSPGKMTQGKFGKGWSKWVDGKRMTVERSRDAFSSPSQKLGDALPEINRDGKVQGDSSRNE